MRYRHDEHLYQACSRRLRTSIQGTQEGGKTHTVQLKFVLLPLLQWWRVRPFSVLHLAVVIITVTSKNY